MKKKTIQLVTSIILASLLSVMFCACGGQEQAKRPDEPAPTIEFVGPTEPEPTSEPEKPAETVEQPETETETGRKDGERFEATIMLEGMEETVKYEHVKDFEIGFELDFEYESLIRQKGSDKESFISTYDDPAKPENYLEVTYTDKNIDSAVSAVSEELSKDYDITTEQRALDRAGSCTMVVTISAKSGAKTPNLLQTVYILPAGDGSIVASAHYTIESAEGFGSRFDQMVNTLAVIGRTAESKISSDQALEAVKKYCLANNPDLESMINSDDKTIYWDVSTSEAGEIVVLYRSYTGAQIRYYINPDSGETYATEQVPGIMDEEQRTDESFNIREYLD